MSTKKLPPYFAVTLVGAFGLAACVGEITSPGGEGKKPPIDVPGSGTQVACSGKICVGASHLSRLTRVQYENSVKELLGAVAVDTNYLPQDQLAAGIFKSTEISPVSDPDVDKYASVAEDVAEAAPLADILSCELANGDQSCAEALIEDLLPRAYRREVTAEERADYLELYQWSIDGGDSFEDAVRLLLTTLLQSPHFLYRMEQGGVDAPRQLNGREVAVRLSYFLWRLPPNAELRAAADAGELDTPEGIEVWARDMLAAPEFDETIREFVREWLGIADVAQASLDPERFPDFSPELAASMLEETERFALDVFRTGDGRQETLLGASYSMIDDKLATLYGVAAPSASGFSRSELTGRAGVLTHASVLTTFSSATYTTPIFRGLFVRKRILCHDMKPRPDNVGELIAELEPTLDPDLDDRERLTALTGNQPCYGCHQLTNPIGFAFEGFDAIGKSRTKDYSGAIIDTASGLGASSPDYATDADGDYAGAVELSKALASSKDVAECLSLQWLRFSLGYDAAGDDSSRAAAHAKYATANHDMRELVIGVVTSDAFRHRVVPTVE